MGGYDALPDDCSNLRGNASETRSIGFDDCLEIQKVQETYLLIQNLTSQEHQKC